MRVMITTSSDHNIKPAITVLAMLISLPATFLLSYYRVLILLTKRRLISHGLSCTALPALAADDVAKLDEVVVTASPIAHDKDYLATIVSNVSRDQILQQGGANLADALANEPGISGSGFASGASRPVIRGFD